MAKRFAVFLYGLVSYMLFFGTFVYAVGFIGNLYVSNSMDSAARMSFLPAAAIDALLLLLFAVQHSVMARPAFKEMLTQFIPEAAERSTYVLASSLLLVALFAFWQPIGGTVWNVDSPVLRNAWYLASASRWCAAGIGTGKTAGPVWLAILSAYAGR